MATACRDVSLVLVGELAKEHGFEADAAIKSLGLDRFVTKRAAPKGKAKAEPKQVIKKPKFPLPYCGVANKCNCRALRLNHGLYTQCTQKPSKGMSYCKTCQQGADRSATGKPTYGTIDDRLAVGVVDYVDPKGKRAVPYANVMEKLNITREDAEAEIKEFSELMGTDTIPEEHWTKREAKRGRPKKVISADEAQKKPKKRGRPAKKEVSGKDADLISALQAAADSSDSESVTSSTSSRGRPRLSEEEKQRRAEEKAQKKAEKEAEKAAAKQQRDQEKAKAKAEKEATKRQSLIDQITALNSEVSTAMDISTMPEDVAELKSMLSNLKKMKKADEKQAAKDAKAAAKQQAEQAATEKKAAAAKALQEKRTPLLDEIKTLATEAGKTVTDFPEKIGELRTMITNLKREIREAKKAAKEAPPAPTQQMEVVSKEDDADQDDDELDEEEVEEENVEATEFIHEGVTYLKDPNSGVLYDEKFKTTGEVVAVGTWNEETQSIDAAPEDDSEDEDEDDDEDESEE